MLEYGNRVRDRKYRKIEYDPQCQSEACLANLEFHLTYACINGEFLFETEKLHRCYDNTSTKLFYNV